MTLSFTGTGSVVDDATTTGLSNANGAVHSLWRIAPGVTSMTVNALVAATHLLIPIQSSYFALEGTDDLLETIEKVRMRPNPALKLLGVLITMHDKRTALARDIRAQIQKVFGGKVFNTVIPRNVRLAEAPSYGVPGVVFDASAKGSQAYVAFARELVELLVSEGAAMGGQPEGGSGSRKATAEVV